MKKFLSLLLAVMMLMSCIPAMADNAEWKINKSTQLVGRKSAAEKSESIVVPADIDGVAVRGVEYMAFNMYENFKTLTIADGSVMLDRSVVRDLTKLETIDLPETLLVIREGNFTNVPMLTSVVVPASVAVVQSSFNKCKSLTSITFEGKCPVFVTEGAYGMFTELPADCVIYVPDNQLAAYKAAFADREDVVARIQSSGQNASAVDWTAPEEDFAFDASTGTITGYTGAANYLKIPATIGGVQVKHIANEAFVQCHSVCCVVIPEGVETVGDWAFAGISLLSYVSLPSTLVTLGDSAFSSAYMSAISFGGDAVPTYDAAAFGDFKGDWQLILPYGSSQAYVEAFAAYLAPAADKGVVKASIIEPYKFPALDAEAGAPFIGTWNSVAVTDGAEYYGMDMLGITMKVVLLADGTGSVDMDDDCTPGGWYVENGTVTFAPILEEGGQPAPEEAITLTQDENGRLSLDLGGLFVLMELEGKTYDVPAIPEKPWPELDAELAQSYIGVWDAVSYISDGETVPAELVGPATLTLNADGTAYLQEGESEAYELLWYAEKYAAYAGPAMSALAEIFFDMNGNLQLKQEDAKIVFAPHVEKKVIEGADELLGTWYDDLGNKLTLTNDGVMTYTYASDGWVYEEKWDVVDGAAVVTEGRWEGAAIYMRDGILFIDNDEGIFQLFSADGDLSAYYGEDEENDEDEMPVAQPIGPEGEPYFGSWTMDLGGMAMNLTLNQDGTCTMEMMGEAEPGVWFVADGKAYVMDDELTIDGDGNLVIASAGMVFTKAEDGASTEEMTEEEQMLALLALLGQMDEDDTSELPERLQPYVGTWHMCYLSTSGLSGDVRPMGVTGTFTINEDGTAAMSGFSSDKGEWYEDDGTVRFGEYGVMLQLLDGGFLQYGTELSGMMIFSQDKEAIYTPGGAAAAPVVPAAPVASKAPAATSRTFSTNEEYLEIKFVATSYTSFGQTMDAATLGSEYSVTFHANGTCEFMMGGVNMPGLTWGLKQVALGLNQVDAFVINYGTDYNFIPTQTGFDMDFFGTMNLHFVPAE